MRTFFPLSFSNRKAISLLCSAAMLLGLSACGEKRSVQCQKVGDILNATSSQRLSASSTSEGFSKGAELSLQAANDLEALELGDKGVSNLRSHLVVNFRDMAQASQGMDSIADEEGYVSSNASTSAEDQAILTAFETTGREFSSTFSALQTYCNGGKVDSALVDQPPS